MRSRTDAPMRSGSSPSPSISCRMKSRTYFDSSASKSSQSHRLAAVVRKSLSSAAAPRHYDVHIMRDSTRELKWVACTAWVLRVWAKSGSSSEGTSGLTDPDLRERT